LTCDPAVTGVFGTVQPGQAGNLSLDAFTGPTYFDWDLSASKDFHPFVPESKVSISLEYLQDTPHSPCASHGTETRLDEWPVAKHQYTIHPLAPALLCG